MAGRGLTARQLTPADRGADRTRTDRLAQSRWSLRRREREFLSLPGVVLRALLFSALSLMISGTAMAGVFKGHARVIDGDEFEMAGKRVRLYGIDAPELGQTCWYQSKEFPCGHSARRNLWLNVKDQRLTCREKSVVDGVVVAICVDAKGRDVAGSLVRSGWALALPKQVEVYAKAEAEARRKNLGLWNFTFTKPWDWRAMMGEN